MSTVKLSLPPEVIADVDYPQEGLRGAHDILVAMDVIDVVGSLVSLGAFIPRLPQLANAIRRWRSTHVQEPTRLKVTGEGIDISVDLDKNVQTADVLNQLMPLLLARRAPQPGDTPTGDRLQGQRVQEP